jgi:co-chaperonin GroES (HSP10)
METEEKRVRTIDTVGAFKNFYLTVKVGSEGDKTDAGLIIMRGERKGNWYRVLAIGPEAKREYCMSDGKSAMIKIGDLLTYHQGISIFVDGREYVTVPDTNILLVIPSEKL